jgi:non-ribosomal peptide synthetase component F
MATELIVPQLLTLPTAWRERTAFTSSLGQLSFGALSEGALGFAAWLARDAGVRPRDRVAICLPRNLEAAQAIIGILAAGAAYVPIQLHGPVLRLCAIIEAIDPKLLVTTGEMKQRLSATGCKLPPVATVEQGGDCRLAPISLAAVRQNRPPGFKAACHGRIAAGQLCKRALSAQMVIFSRRGPSGSPSR